MGYAAIAFSGGIPIFQICFVISKYLLYICDMKEIKDNIVRLLSEQGRTQRELCIQLGITTQNLQYYFGGNITMRNLCRLAEALGVEPWVLLKPYGVDEELPRVVKSDPVKLSFRCPHCGRRLKMEIE